MIRTGHSPSEEMNSAAFGLKRTAPTLSSVERIALEIQRTCDHVDRRFNYAGVARVLVSPLPQGLGVLEYLSANLAVRVQQLDLNEVLDLSALPEARDALWQAHHLSAIGAALRELPEAA